MRDTRRYVWHGARFAAIAGVVSGTLMVGQGVTSGSSAPEPDGSHITRALDTRDAPDARHSPDAKSSPDATVDPGAEVGPDDMDDAEAPRDAGLAANLLSELGMSRTAGSWTAADGHAVVAVTDEDAAAEVSRAGARPKLVRHSMRQLHSAAETLRAAPRVTGTAWAVDAASNKVVVLADSTVSADDWSRLKGVAGRVGDEVGMRRTAGSFTTRTSGADPIFTPGGRCSAGFNVTNGQTSFILTAGHCGPTGTSWSEDTQGATNIGTTVASSFPDNDYSLVRYQNRTLDRSSVVNLGAGRGVRITASADPAVGQQVFRNGSTTGLRTGEVTALNATVNYPEGTVTGLIQTSVCAEPGDSGGPLFAQGLALGLTSGGSGDCAAGGVTFFQPVTEALRALGVNIPGAPAVPAAAPVPPSGNSLIPSTEDVAAAVDEIVGYLPRIGPGLLITFGGILGLLATRRLRPGATRRQYPGYSTTWS